MWLPNLPPAWCRKRSKTFSCSCTICGKYIVNFAVKLWSHILPYVYPVVFSQQSGYFKLKLQTFGFVDNGSLILITLQKSVRRQMWRMRWALVFQWTMADSALQEVLLLPCQSQMVGPLMSETLRNSLQKANSTPLKGWLHTAVIFLYNILMSCSWIASLWIDCVFMVEWCEKNHIFLCGILALKIYPCS